MPLRRRNSSCLIFASCGSVRDLIAGKAEAHLSSLALLSGRCDVMSLRKALSTHTRQRTHFVSLPGAWILTVSSAPSAETDSRLPLMPAATGPQRLISLSSDHSPSRANQYAT